MGSILKKIMLIYKAKEYFVFDIGIIELDKIIGSLLYI